MDAAERAPQDGARPRFADPPLTPALAARRRRVAERLRAQSAAEVNASLRALGYDERKEERRRAADAERARAAAALAYCEARYRAERLRARGAPADAVSAADAYADAVRAERARATLAAARYAHRADADGRRAVPTVRRTPLPGTLFPAP